MLQNLGHEAVHDRPSPGSGAGRSRLRRRPAHHRHRSPVHGAGQRAPGLPRRDPRYLHGVGARSLGEPRQPEHLDPGGPKRRDASPDDDRPRLAGTMVPRRPAYRLCFAARRQRSAVHAERRRPERADPADQTLRRRRQHRLVARRTNDRLHVRGVSRLPGRCLQRRTRRGAGEESRRRRASTTRCCIAIGHPGARASALTCSSSPSTGGTPRDLMPGANYDVPPREREGPHPIAFSPDGRMLCFTAIIDRVEATSTNADLFEVDLNAGTPRQADHQSGIRRRAGLFA